MKATPSSWGKTLSISSSALALALAASTSAANDIVEALQDSNTTGEIRLRFENVEQDNPLDDSDALTLRTRLTYTTGAISGFSGVLEMEDVRIVGGVGDYSVPVTGYNPGEYSVIADPETTELDQAYLQYKNDLVTLKGGRQVITYHDHRFVGHVGWRQDKQTFDALSAAIAPSEELVVNYSFVTQRNRIFAEAADIRSEDHLLNASYKLPVGELAAYAYLLEEDETGNTLDTYGLRFSGSTGDALKFNYALAYATQESEASTADFDADYLLAEGGMTFPFATVTLGYELLGSDNGEFGFSTPLATLHKFNGWADIFLATPAQGLADTYLSVGGKLAKGNWTVAYHDFQADEDTPTIDDFGNELDLQFVWPFNKNVSVGVKYAAYDAGDAATGLVDTDKFWLWSSLSF